MGNFSTKNENNNINDGDIDSMYGYSLTRSSMTSSNMSRRKRMGMQQKKKEEDMKAFWIVFVFLGWIGIHYFILPSKKCLYIAPLIRLFLSLVIFVLITYVLHFELLYILIILTLNYILYSIMEFIYIKKNILNNDNYYENDV